MSVDKEWKITVGIQERHDERTTHARAHLDSGDGVHRTGTGTAIRFPRDPDVPAVGDDLAVARALRDLANQLATDATADLDDARGQLWDVG